MASRSEKLVFIHPRRCRKLSYIATDWPGSSHFWTLLAIIDHYWPYLTIIGYQVVGL